MKSATPFLASIALLWQPSSTHAGQPRYAALEKEVAEAHNLLRTRPLSGVAYLEDVLERMDGQGRVRLDENTYLKTTEGRHAVVEAIAFLRQQKPLPALLNVSGLATAAKSHAVDQSATGRVGHQSSDGSSPNQRILRQGFSTLTGENIHYGDSKAMAVVMDLIVDDGVPDRGHRTNIFSPEYRMIGVGCSAHKVYGNVCVVNYAGNFLAGKGKPPSYSLKLTNVSNKTLNKAELVVPSADWSASLLDSPLRPRWSASFSSQVPVALDSLACNGKVRLSFTDGSSKVHEVNLCKTDKVISINIE